MPVVVSLEVAPNAVDPLGCLVGNQSFFTISNADISLSTSGLGTHRGPGIVRSFPPVWVSSRVTGACLLTSDKSDSSALSGVLAALEPAALFPSVPNPPCGALSSLVPVAAADTVGLERLTALGVAAGSCSRLLRNLYILPGLVAS